MKRHVSFLLTWTVLALLAQLTIVASSAFADTAKCMVINDRINTTYKFRYPDSMNPVQDAIDEASPWDIIWIRGYCPGPVTITKSLTLEGQEIPGFQYAPTLDASMFTSSIYDKESVVHVSGIDVQVQINSLILTGGGNVRFAVEHGGGILNEQADVTLNSVTITGNWAYFGGGIFNDNGTVELNNSTVDSNFVKTMGGGIFSEYGTVILNASTITNNKRGGTSEGISGGGISGWAASVFASNSEIAYNYEVNDIGTDRIPAYGGGIYVGSGPDEPRSTLTLTDTTIHDNWADQGGGIFAIGANVTLMGSSELSGNYAERRGGGAYVGGNLVLSGDTRIHDNTAGNRNLNPVWGPGGGVAFAYVSTSDRFTMSGNATIYDNAAVSSGGGIDGPSAYLVNCVAGTEGDEGVNVFNNLPYNINYD